MIGDVYYGTLRNTRVTLIEQSNGLLLVPRLKDFYYTKTGEPTNDVTRSFGPVTSVEFSHSPTPGLTHDQWLKEMYQIEKARENESNK